MRRWETSVAVAIKNKPTGTVSSMSAPKRDGGFKMLTTWKHPSAVTSQSSDKRATGVHIRTVIDGKVGAKKYSIRQDRTYGSMLTESNRNINDFPAEYPSSKTWHRSDFYPLTKRTLSLFWTHVKLRNEKGEGPWRSTKFKFEKPRKPSITKIVQGEGNGYLTCTVNTNAGTDRYDRYDTRYIVTMYNSRTKVTSTTDTTTQSTSFTVSRDARERSQLTYGQYIKLRVRACARGLAGSSEWAERNYYVSWPPLPVVKGIDVSTKNPSGKVTVRINLKENNLKKNKDWNTKYNTQHPVTGCRLEYLRNTEAKTATEAAASESWVEMDYQDNGNCSALSASVAELTSERSLHTWVRVKSWNDIESIFYRYSTPVEVKKLYQAPPSASESNIVIVDAESGGDGRSAVLTIGWNRNGADTMTGTEVSWSDNVNAWRSTTEPNAHEFTWSDGALTSGNVTYQDSAVLHVDGLQEGTTYYFRARRYQDRDTGDRLYGAYCRNTMSAIPTTSPSSVTLYAASSIAEGRPLEVTWAYDSESMQTAYEIITGTVTNSTDSEGNETHWIASSGTKVVATGNDSRGSYVIQADRLEELAVNGSIALAVRVSTGGDFVTSQATTVTINTPPVAGLSVATVTAQGQTLTVTSNVGTAAASVLIVAHGSDGSMPDGSIAQVAGDVVWSDTITPEWSESSGTFSAQIPMPNNLPLYDGAGYTVTVTLVDSETELASEPVSDDFEVEWSHQAPKPSDQIAISCSDSTDEDGLRTISAAISLQSPQGAVQGDLYDVYRVLDDEVQLIAEGRALSSTVTDNYVPFGNRSLAYRVACRTADGDVDWNDYEYGLLPRSVTDGLMMRIDFGDRYVELDRGVSYSDRRAKTFAGRSHMGEMTQRGYWGDEIKRSGQSSAAAIMVYESDIAERLDALAVHRGPCYVRLSTGVAYEADVQVSGPNISVGSAGMQYSLSITKIALTQEYMAVPVNSARDGE